MFRKNTNQPKESVPVRRVIQSSRLRQSPYAYHNDRRARPSSDRDNSAAVRQVRRNEDGTTIGASQEARGAKIRRLIRKRKIVLSTAAVGIFVVLFGSLYLSTTAKVEILGDAAVLSLRAAPEYEQAAAKYLSGSIANRNKITIDSAGLERSMRSMFPELRVVQLEVPLFGSAPILHISMSKPLVTLQTTSGSGFVVDESGYSIAPATDETARLGLPLLVDQNPVTIVRGQQVLPKSSMQFISLVLSQYKAKNIAVESLILPQAAHELNVRAAGDPYYVKYLMLNLDTALQQIGSYFSMQGYLRENQITPKEYVDVRINGRAYYK